MAKILTDAEMENIIHRAVHYNEIDCADSYRHFLEDLADLICTHFGGERGEVQESDSDFPSWTCAFRVNECVPADGGVFANFDRDIIWKDGKEQEA